MPTPIWLTDEDADISGFKRAKVPINATQPNKSDCPSLVRAATNTVAGPATVAVVRQVGSAVFNQGWITDPLNGPALSTGTWVLHAWAQVSSVLANAGLRLDVSKYGGTSVVSASSPALTTTTQDIAFTTGAAAAQQLAQGDRLIIKLSLVDAGGTMASGFNATVSYNGMYSRIEGDTYVLCPDSIGLVGNQTGQLGDIPDDDIIAVRTVLRDFSSQVGLSQSPQLDDPEVIRYILQAVETYSVDRPFVTAYYYSGDGTTFNFPLPPKFIWGFSRCVSIEYPADQQIPNPLEYLDWELRDQILGTQPQRFIRMRTVTPDNATNNLFVQYTTRHQYSTEFSTIPKEDMDAILWLAGSYCATAIASKFAGATDSTLEADVVRYGDLQTKWMSVARALLDLYMKRVVDPDSATPVGSTHEWKPVLETGQAMLWHSRRIRRTNY